MFTVSDGGSLPWLAPLQMEPALQRDQEPPSLLEDEKPQHRTKNLRLRTDGYPTGETMRGVWQNPSEETSGLAYVASLNLSEFTKDSGIIRYRLVSVPSAGEVGPSYQVSLGLTGTSKLRGYWMGGLAKTFEGVRESVVGKFLEPSKGGIFILFDSFGCSVTEKESGYTYRLDYPTVRDKDDTVEDIFSGNYVSADDTQVAMTIRRNKFKAPAKDAPKEKLYINVQYRLLKTLHPMWQMYTMTRGNALIGGKWTDHTFYALTEMTDVPYAPQLLNSAGFKIDFSSDNECTVTDVPEDVGKLGHPVLAFDFKLYRLWMEDQSPTLGE